MSSQQKHAKYLQRCLELAAIPGAGVSPNPMVGAVIVYQDRIIGEGYHRQPGQPHAEILALNQVRDPAVLAESTLYVSLEPCSHFGRTPPCVDQVIAAGFKQVVIGAVDPNPQVYGQGIKKLKEAGVEVILAENPEPFVKLNKVFHTNQTLKRPYILLKWAETANGFIGRTSGERLLITGQESMRYQHYLRSRYAAIMIGKNTAYRDNPQLNVRQYHGSQPTRIVFDVDLMLPHSLNIFSSNGKVIVINKKVNVQTNNRIYFAPEEKEAFLNLELLVKALYQKFEISSILVEGGRYLLQQFVNQELYDEMQVFRAPFAVLDADVSSPALPNTFRFDEFLTIGRDILLLKHATRF